MKYKEQMINQGVGGKVTPSAAVYSNMMPHNMDLS